MRKSEPAVAEHARPTDIPLVTLRRIGTRGAWGARAATGTRTRISISADHARFLDVLTATR
ncbi:hypothetical protein VM98_23675 [Streptomyces rubellomurinus subsp. indigoferus]|nr:hypothetical protein VM98_23675 [Streptomyces rubellomurinus subsp. indigoferus]